MGQPVAFFEVVSPDHERAQTFYGGLFGWQVAAGPVMGGYGLVDTGAGEGAIGGESVRPREARGAGKSTCGSMTSRPAWAAPGSGAASGWSRRPACPAATAGSPSSPARTATRPGCGAEAAR